MVQQEEIQVQEEHEVVADHYNGIHLIEEYLDENKPDYEWDSKDNLIAQLEFSKNEPFPEWVFQKFLVENQRFAKETYTWTNQYQEELKHWQEWNETKDEPEPINLENYNVTMVDEIEDEEQENEPEYSEVYIEEEPIPKFKKAIWRNGICLGYETEERGKPKIVPVEITCERYQNVVFIKVGGYDEPIYRKALNELINTFTSNLSFKCLAVCNCPLCQEKEKKTPGSGYRFTYSCLQNLHERFVPKIQCYESGKNRLLDEISHVERPELKVVFIHNLENDNDFIYKAKRLLRSELKTEISDLVSIPPGKETDKYFEDKINSAGVVIILMSPYFADDDKALMFSRFAIKKANQQKALLLGIEIRDTAEWKETAPFRQLERGWTMLNDKPISSLDEKEVDAVWKKTSEKLQNEIEHWLNKEIRFKLQH